MRRSELPEKADYTLWLREAEQRYRIAMRRKGRFSHDIANILEAAIMWAMIYVYLFILRLPHPGVVGGVVLALLMFGMTYLVCRLSKRLLLN